MINSNLFKTSNSIIKSLQWRSALKSFQPFQADKQQQLNESTRTILEGIRLSPSSFGIQPYHVHVINNNKLKEKLKEVSFNQKQVTECSSLLIFTARNDPIESVERFISQRNLDSTYASFIRNTFNKMNKQEFAEFAKNQAFIGLGVGVTIAADLRIGSCPMTGFLPDEVHKILNLPINEVPVCYLAIGSESDSFDATEDKFRFDINDIVRYHN